MANRNLHEKTLSEMRAELDGAKRYVSLIVQRALQCAPEWPPRIPVPNGITKVEAEPVSALVTIFRVTDEDGRESEFQVRVTQRNG